MKRYILKRCTQKESEPLVIHYAKATVHYGSLVHCFVVQRLSVDGALLTSKQKTMPLEELPKGL